MSDDATAGDPALDPEAVDALLADDLRVERVIPSWLFRWSGDPSGYAIAVIVPALLTVFLLDNADQGDLRPAGPIVVALIAPAILAGWRAALVSTSLTWVSYWYLVVPPRRSFSLESLSSAFGVLSFFFVAAGITLLARRLEDTVRSVRALDRVRDLAMQMQRDRRRRVERRAARRDVLVELAGALAPIEEVSAVADAATDLLAVRLGAVSASVAMLEGGTARILSAQGTSDAVSAAVEATDLRTSRWLSDALAGEMVVVESREEFARANPQALVLSLFDSKSWVIAPLKATTTIGLLALHFDHEQQVDDDERTFLRLAAQLLAVSLERAAAAEARRREQAALALAFAERDRIARILQTTLAPKRLPTLPGFDVAAVLVPGSADEVAGDFYDIVFPPAGGWLAVMGDVCGKGAAAAAVTALVRYAARGAAIEDADPVRVAKITSDALRLESTELYCTLVAVRAPAEPDGVLELVLAGHPKPLLVTAGGAQAIGTFGTPLGIDLPPALHPVTIRLAQGDALVLASDGVLDRSSSFGEPELMRLVEQHHGASAQELLDAIMGELARHPIEHVDDVSVLVLRRDGVAG